MKYNNSLTGNSRKAGCDWHSKSKVRMD